MKPLSLRHRLTWLIIAVMVAVLIPLGIISYQRERREMNELLDGRLAEAGRTLGVLIENSDAGANHAAIAKDADIGRALIVAVHRRNYEPDVGFQVYDGRGRPMVSTANFASLPPPRAEQAGFGKITLDGYLWRTFILQNRAGLLIRIGERYDNRLNIDRGLMLEHGLPLLIGLPLLALLALWAVRRGLRPLDELTGQLAQRTPGSRQPVAIELAPEEIRPLIATLNQQLERLEDAIERERRMTADMAHELRTPLAATMLQLDSAAIASSPDDARAALQHARQGASRLARRIEQILSMAQLEAGAAATERSPQDLTAIVTSVIEELAPLIADKDITLSLLHDGTPLRVPGHEVALTAMLRNLIENAMRYVSQGGQVEVALSHAIGVATIDISDDGPGIPAEHRETVFERFRRETHDTAGGYGVGLNIVRRAAQLHDARIDLLDSPFGKGLRVRVEFLLDSTHP
ncbi:sensor histidine kinase N-terminal domain-containing protein [Rhodanobacter sp. 7MK24]|uniref:sensor histidine kinase n=1 Tax=Rhodanobacter sp. 7MK24 TaxID=2775922 RepID=UPI0017841933|nr:ATP-binding protein [Rhodanobacter sp. 7MK24]MBD8882234.1 sensor histidine kinase N-terminal domain-containing protein [Rhodanobacter sp. 7MK24]